MYITTALLYLFVWWLMPGFAFLLFIVITAWHFGETDVVAFDWHEPKQWLTFCYGFALTCWLLMQDRETLLYWTNLITHHSAIAAEAMRMVSSIPVWVWYAVICFLLFTRGNSDQKMWVQKLLFLSFLLALSRTTLLSGFVLYFCGWHSVNALSHIKAFAFNRISYKKMVWKAIPPTLAALMFLILVGQLSTENWLQHNGLPALFILLSILTLPHMTEMHRLYTARQP